MPDRLPLSLLFSILATLVMAGPVAIGGTAPVEPYEAPEATRVAPLQSSQIDVLVRAKLGKTGVESASICSDAVFLRRVHLDVIGTLPTAEEAKAFLADKANDKRRALIDRLLARPEYAEYWGMKWGDVLRVKSEFPVNLWPNAAQAYDRWIRTRIRENTPCSRMAGDLLTASGSNFRSPAVNFLRSAGGTDPKALARAAALAFMGQRAEKWPESKLADMAVFFSRVGFKKTAEWKEEIVFFDGMDESRPLPAEARLPDGSMVKLAQNEDPRAVFARWLVESKNSPFARNTANRVWFWVFGRGIVHEPDDFRADNPASNPELLALLARELASHDYDVKHLLRMILNSNTYQSSCLPRGQKGAGEENFASYPLRRLEAEVLIDAINAITGSTEEYSSMIPEPFTWVPESHRTISLPDASISSAFLDLFGRPPRDTGLLSERNDRSTTAQRLHLLNSKHVLQKINTSAKLRALYKSADNPKDMASSLYLTILSRYPTPAELATLRDYAALPDSQNWQVPGDIVWALINSPEFLFRH